MMLRSWSWLRSIDNQYELIWVEGLRALRASRQTYPGVRWRSVVIVVEKLADDAAIAKP